MTENNISAPKSAEEKRFITCFDIFWGGIYLIVGIMFKHFATQWYGIWIGYLAFIVGCVTGWLIIRLIIAFVYYISPDKKT